jgi:predicted nucleic acid-binding protein
MDRAVQVAGAVARTGQHRGAKPVDLVIAAAAEATGLWVLHYDSDYDRIAAATNQPTEWIAPAGTLD